jgi:hypothetical protein
MSRSTTGASFGVVLSFIFFSLTVAAHDIAHAAKPGSTMDLSGVTQNWDKKLPNDARFTILTDFNNQAVRDNETGLVWELTPETSPRTWEDAVRTCWLRQVGGRAGWHLPMIEELASLVDPTVPTPPGPALPQGHPFQNVQQTYWSGTMDVRVQFIPTQAWVVRFGGLPFGINAIIGDNDKGTPNFVWCVRGGTHADKYK